ncbi:DUF1801 domain-containing protein [Candidatus Nephthysia bennettiae]
MAEVESPVLFIVDGDQEARRATESTLVRRFFPDYRVLATSTSQVGPDELERLAERGDHVVLVATDLQLPGMARDHAFSQMAGGAQKEMKTVADSSNKTTANDGDVGVFLDGVTEDQRRRDAQLLVDVMREVTGRPPVMWGASIVGFGSRHYRYASGREGDVAAVAFSPRKAQTVLYLTGVLEEYDDLLPRLGQHQTGKGCLYLKRVDQADPDALRAIVARSYRSATTGPGGAQVSAAGEDSG